MTTLPVRLYPDKILRQPTELITDFTGMEALSQAMVETMHGYKGVGLAAPQIGLSIQLAILNLENKNKILVVANPVILCYTKEKDIQPEGCLSSPGITVNMERFLGIDIECQFLTGEVVQLRLTDYDARIAQHELDHLQGKCIADKISKLGML